MLEKNNNRDEIKSFFLIKENQMNSKKLAKQKKRDWVEETFINYSEEEINKGNKNFIGLALSRRSFNILISILFVCLGLLLAKSAYLQVIQGDDYLSMAEKNRIRIYNIQAPRGIIYDRNYIELVKNVPSFSLYLTPVDFPKEENQQQQIINELQKYLTADFTIRLDEILQMDRRRKEYYQPQILVENIDYEKAILLKIISAKLAGINIEISNQRDYLYNYEYQENEFLYNSLSHLLGYMGKISPEQYEKLEEKGYLYNDVVGKSGIEYSAEEILRGVYGKKKIEVDSVGNEKKVIAQEDLHKGDNIVLTIDLKMQNKLEELLRQSLIKNNKKKAVGIVQDPNNGQILAMVSLPSYNNNLFAKGIESQNYQKLISEDSQPLFNRAISGEYPSGSTIKPVIAASALQEGIIDENTSFLSVGGIRVGQWFFPDWRAGGHGITNVRKALADSINTFFYIIGGGYHDFEGLGVYKIKEYGQKFGLTAKTNIQLPNEKQGFLPSPEWKQQTKNEQWYIGDTYHLAIGQGDLLVTPLQVSNYMSVFANQGTLYQPSLIAKIIDSATKNETVVLPEILNANFIDNYNILIVRQGMRQTITTGSAQLLNSLPITAAGKTGTAQWGNEQNPHAWFTCFAPYENPQIVVTIMIEEGGEGSSVAVPIARDFIYWYYLNYQ